MQELNKHYPEAVVRRFETQGNFKVRAGASEASGKEGARCCSYDGIIPILTSL